MRQKLLLFVRFLFLRFFNLTSKKIFNPGLSLICLVMFFVFSVGNAATFYSKATGSPSTLGSWGQNTDGSGTAPTTFANTGDVFIIRSGSTMTTTGDWTVGGTVTINNGGSLQITSGNTDISFGNFNILNGGTSTVYRDLTVTGSTNISGTINFGSNNGNTKNMSFGGSVILNSGAVWNETTNGASATISFGNSFTNNATTFTVQNTAHSFTGSGMTLSGSTSTTIPNVAITGSYTNNITTFTVSNALSGSGTLTNASGSTLNISNSSSIAVANLINTGTLNVNNNGTVTGITNNAGGTVNLNGSGTITTFNNATSTSQLNINATTVPTITTLTTTAAGNTVNYNGGGNQTIKSNTYSNLTTSNSGTKTLGGAITVNGNLSIGSGTTLDTSNGNNYAITVGGDFNSSGSGAFTPRSGTVTLSGTNQTFNVSSFYNLTLGGTSGTKTFASSGATAISNNLVINSGIVANLGTQTHTANTLTLGTNQVLPTSWGNTVSPALSKNDVYFTANTGIVNVTTSTCTNFTSVAPITSVALNTLLKTSSSSTSSPVYDNFVNDTPTSLIKGQYYNLTVKGNTNGAVNGYYTAYFDWNNNGDFTDSGENFTIGTIRESSGTDGKVASVYLLVPTTAITGNIKMRIVGRINGYSTGPCVASGSIGQIEDYTVTLQTSCSGSLPSTVSTSSTSSTVCPNVPFTLSLGNTFGDGATYVWQTGPSSTGPWTNATAMPTTFFTSTFSTNQAANTTVGDIALSGNDTTITGGALVLTDTALGGHNGGFLINKNNTANITPFTVKFKYRIADGTGADGMSLSYGQSLPADAGGGESGEGSGIIVQFDTFDNEGVTTGSRVRVLYNNVQLFTTAIDAPFNLRTSTFRNVNLTVDSSGYLSLVIENSMGVNITAVSKLLLPGYAALANKSNWKFKFSARTGGSNDKHSIDDLTITYLDDVSSNSTFTTSQTAATYYRAIITCGGSSVTSTPTLVSMTTATISAKTAATCSGTAFTVTPATAGSDTVPTGTTYTWPIPVVTGGMTGGVANSTGSSNITGTLNNTSGTAQTATYTVTPTTSGCTGPTFTVTVTVNPRPVPTFTAEPASPTCAGTPVTYTTQSGMSNYIWGFPGAATTDYVIISGGSTADNTVTLRYVSAGSKAVTVNYTNSNTCTATTASSSNAITVNPLPQGSLTANGPFCGSGSGQLTFTSSAGTGPFTVVYNDGTADRTATGVVSGTAFAVSPSATVSATTTYTLVSVTGANSCSRTASFTGASATITINPIHSISPTTADRTVCQNAAMTAITMTLGGGATGASVIGLPTGVSYSVSSNTLTISGNPSVIGVFNYSVTTTGNSCTVANASGTITVGIGNNTVNFVNGTSATVCVNPAENGNASFTAPAGTYFNTVSFASYGLPNGSCGAFTIGSCHSTVSQSVTEGFLLGNTGTVSFTASNAVLTDDPCVGTVKRYYASAAYSQPICAGTIPGQITGSTPTGAGGYTYLWQMSTTSATTGFSAAPGTNNGQNYTPSVAVSVNTWFRRVVSYSGNTCPSISPAVLIKVNPRATSIVSGTTAICNGASTTISVALTGTAPWSLTRFDGTTSTNITGITASPYTFSVSPTTNTTYTITALNDVNNCPSIPADRTGSAVITVNPLPTTPTATVDQDYGCEEAGAITLTDLPSGTWTIHQTGTASQDITESGSSWQITGLVPGPYSFTVENENGCISAVVSETISNESVTTWNGSSWDHGLPEFSKAVIFAGDFIIGSDIEACSITVNAGANITVNSGYTLIVKNIVTTNGTLTFENNSSLIQETSAANSGNIVYRRITPNVRRYDFTRWSVPVNNPAYTMHDLSPETLADKYYYYHPVDGWKINGNGTLPMEIGRGYSIRAPQTYDITGSGAPYAAEFEGIPNNGDIPYTVTPGFWNMIGNPYPSALSAREFVERNSVAGTDVGALYFWTHKSLPSASVPGDEKYNYTSDDYAVWTLTGGTVTQSGAATPSGYIAAAQGFFIEPAGDEDIIFNNDMRVGGNNTQFFKTKETVATEQNRVWLNFTNTKGAFKQILLGYIEGATNSIDKNYDAETMSGNSYIDFYTISDALKLTIQARAVPFNDTEIVPLGYKTTIAGDFTIAIDHADGLFDSQKVYLEDKTTGIITDLQASNYTFTTAIGTFTNRFTLRYTSKTLGTGDFENLDDSVLISVKDKAVKVSSSKENIKDVTIYNVGAEEVFSKKKINATEFQINNLQVSPQVLLVKVTLENGYQVTKKIIFH